MDRFNQSTSDKKKESIKNKLVKIEILLQKSHADCRDRKEQLALKAIKTNPKFFFSYAKQFSSTRSKIGPLLNKLNEYTASSTEMANLLSTQYSSVHSIPKDSPYFAMEEEVDSVEIKDIDFRKLYNFYANRSPERNVRIQKILKKITSVYIPIFVICFSAIFWIIGLRNAKFL